LCITAKAACAAQQGTIFVRSGGLIAFDQEAIWVAAEMRAGGAYAHSTLMLATLAEEEENEKTGARAAARGTVVGYGRRGQPAVVATEWNDVGSPRLLLPNGE
jgi:hypothetical protein